MDKIIELLMRQPLIVLLVGAWLVGMVTNAMKAQKKAKERREAQLRPTKVATPETAAEPTPAKAAADKGPGEAVASMGTGQRQQLADRRKAPASMRSRMKDESAWPAPKSGPAQPAPAAKKATSPDEIAAEMRRIFGLDSKPAPKVERQPARPEPVRVEPEAVPTEPRNVRVRSSEPPLRSSVDSHVGERARDRHLKESTIGQTRGKRGAIGNLGGRVQARKKRVQASRRFPMEDLKRIIVMNEILSPPVTLRDQGDDRFR